MRRNGTRTENNQKGQPRPNLHATSHTSPEVISQCPTLSQLACALRSCVSRKSITEVVRAMCRAIELITECPASSQLVSHTKELPVVKVSYVSGGVQIEIISLRVIRLSSTLVTTRVAHFDFTLVYCTLTFSSCERQFLNLKKNEKKRR